MHNMEELPELSEAPDSPAVIDRRHFMKLAAAAAASGTAGALTVPAAAQGRGTNPPQQAPPIPLGNGEPPALQFQPYPGGTGAWLEKLARERGRASFERSTFDLEPWSGPVPSSEEEVVFLPVHRLAVLIQSRRISAVQLTDMYLNRLQRLDPALLCAVTIMDGQAREAAQQADAEIRAGRYRGPLHGIPWGVKDLFATRGVRTTWGSKAHENQMFDHDAEVVVRLREAGAVLIAKLATGLFAQGDNWYRGQTKNPWNLTQGSSGSSAGPASATAAGCVAFAIGTETQGSIVSPARRCGISALRPTFGRVSRYGGMVLAWSMDKVGPMCRTLEDCALVFNTIHGADEKDPSTVTAPFQFSRNPDWSRLRIGHAEDAPEAFVNRLRELGAQVKPIGARPGTAGLNSLGVEAATAFDAYVSTLPAGYVDSVLAAGRGRGAGGRGGEGGRGREAGRGAAGRGEGRGRGAPPPPADNSPAAAASRFGRGRSALAMDFLQSQRRRLIVMQQMAELMKDYDMYVSGSGDVGLTNQTGHPAVIVPYMMSEGENSQPQCTTIIGNLFEDDRILSVANAYQRATDWHLRRPKL